MTSTVGFVLDIRILDLKLEKYPKANGMIFVDVSPFEAVSFRFDSLPLSPNASGILCMLPSEFIVEPITGSIKVSLVVNSKSGYRPHCQGSKEQMKVVEDSSFFAAFKTPSSSVSSIRVATQSHAKMSLTHNDRGVHSLVGSIEVLVRLLKLKENVEKTRLPKSIAVHIAELSPPPPTVLEDVKPTESPPKLFIPQESHKIYPTVNEHNRVHRAVRPLQFFVEIDSEKGLEHEVQLQFSDTTKQTSTGQVSVRRGMQRGISPSHKGRVSVWRSTDTEILRRDGAVASQCRSRDIHEQNRLRLSLIGESLDLRASLSSRDSNSDGQKTLRLSTGIDIKSISLYNRDHEDSKLRLSLQKCDNLRSSNAASESLSTAHQFGSISSESRYRSVSPSIRYRQGQESSLLQSTKGLTGRSRSPLESSSVKDGHINLVQPSQGQRAEKAVLDSKNSRCKSDLCSVASYPSTCQSVDDDNDLDSCASFDSVEHLFDFADGNKSEFLSLLDQLRPRMAVHGDSSNHGDRVSYRDDEKLDLGFERVSVIAGETDGASRRTGRRDGRGVETDGASRRTERTYTSFTHSACAIEASASSQFAGSSALTQSSTQNDPSQLLQPPGVLRTPLLRATPSGASLPPKAPRQPNARLSSENFNVHKTKNRYSSKMVAKGVKTEKNTKGGNPAPNGINDFNSAIRQLSVALKDVSYHSPTNQKVTKQVSSEEKAARSRTLVKPAIRKTMAVASDRPHRGSGKSTFYSTVVHLLSSKEMSEEGLDFQPTIVNKNPDRTIVSGISDGGVSSFSISRPPLSTLQQQGVRDIQSSKMASNAFQSSYLAPRYSDSLEDRDKDSMKLKHIVTSLSDVGICMPDNSGQVYYYSPV